MPVGSVAIAVPPQITAALAAVTTTESAELAASTQLAGQAASASANPNLGQLVNLSV